MNKLQNSVGLKFWTRHLDFAWPADADYYGAGTVNLTRGDQWDVVGQIVDASGSLVGGPIAIATEAGAQNFPWIAFDGTNYFVTWTDMTHDANHDDICGAGESTCWDLAGRWVTPAGALVGARTSLVTDDGNQLLAQVLVAAGGDPLLLWNDLDTFDGNVGDVWGSFRVRPGDTAPRGAPDGLITVQDAIVALRFSVRLDAPTAAEMADADVAPVEVIDASVSPRKIRSAPDGLLTIGDVIIDLRIAVGLDRF